MNKGSIIKALIVFLTVTVFMYFAGLLLGKNNAIMGLLIVLSILMLLGKDLTGNPYRNMLKISLLGVGSVVCAYLVNLNLYGGLLINFIWIFLLIYLNVFNLKVPMYVSFLLTYIMLLTMGTTVKEIVPRSLALVFSGIIVVLIQVIMRKKKLKNNRRPNLMRCLRVLDNEIEAIINKKDISDNISSFNEAINTWNKNILERKQNNFYFTAKENRQSILIANLEQFQGNIVELKNMHDKDESYEVVFVSLRLVINEVIKLIKHRATITDVKARLAQYQLNAKDKINNYNVYSISEVTKIFLKLIDKKDYETEDTQILAERPSIFKLIKYSFNKDSLRFTFAMRMAILIAISYFVVDGLNLHNGKWILFTLMSVCQPYDFSTLKVGKDRLIGTIIGALIVFLTFGFIEIEAIRVGILAIGFYIFISVKNPIVKGAGTTLFALGIAELGVKAGAMSMIITGERFLYTVIGFVIAIIGSKIIFHYDIKKETKMLLDRYAKILEANVSNLIKSEDIKDMAVKLRASMLMTKSMESKLIINNTILKDKGIDLYLEHSRNTLINVYDSLRRIKIIADKDEIGKVKKKVESFYKKFNTRFEHNINFEIEEEFILNDKSALYISLTRVIEEFYNSRQIKKDIMI